MSLLKSEKIIDDDQNNSTEKLSDSTIQKKISKNDNIIVSWWNSDLTEKVHIYDNENSSEFVFAMETTNEGEFLLNKNQVILSMVQR